MSEEPLKPRAEPQGHPGLLIYICRPVLIAPGVRDDSRGISEGLRVQNKRDSVPRNRLLACELMEVGINHQFGAVEQKLSFGFLASWGRVVVVEGPHALRGSVGVNGELHGSSASYPVIVALTGRGLEIGGGSGNRHIGGHSRKNMEPGSDSYLLYWF